MQSTSRGSHGSHGLHSPGSTSVKSFEVANWRMEGLGRDSDTGSEDEFFDCTDQVHSSDAHASLAKWSSLELLNQDDDQGDSVSPTAGGGDKNGKITNLLQDYLWTLNS